MEEKILKVILKITGNEVRNAIANVINGISVSKCGIKINYIDTSIKTLSKALSKALNNDAKNKLVLD